MIRWFMLWRARRQRDKLSADVDWIRDGIWSAQLELNRKESALMAAQAEVWILESTVNLLDPSRTASGGLIPRR